MSLRDSKGSGIVQLEEVLIRRNLVSPESRAGSLGAYATDCDLYSTRAAGAFVHVGGHVARVDRQSSADRPRGSKATFHPDPVAERVQFQKCKDLGSDSGSDSGQDLTPPLAVCPGRATLSPHPCRSIHLLLSDERPTSQGCYRDLNESVCSLIR